MKNVVTHNSKKLWLTVDTDCNMVNLWTLANCIEKRLNRHFDIPGGARIWTGVETTDRHGRYAFPQFATNIQYLGFVNRISIVWDKIYFRDEQKAPLKFFSNEDGWCWFNKFTDDRIVSGFLMDVLEGVFDYIDYDRTHDGGKIGDDGFYIYSRNKSDKQNDVCLQYIPTRQPEDQK